MKARTAVPITYDAWLGKVRSALSEINMPLDEWQTRWPFDFMHEYNADANPTDAAAKANRFWWREQNKAIGQNCRKRTDCWLPHGHQGTCEPI